MAKQKILDEARAFGLVFECVHKRNCLVYLLFSVNLGFSFIKVKGLMLASSILPIISDKDESSKLLGRERGKEI